MAEQQPQQFNKPIYDRTQVRNNHHAPAAAKPKVTVGRWQPVNQTEENAYLNALRDARAPVDIQGASGEMYERVVITAVNIYTLLVKGDSEYLLFKSRIESIRKR